MILSFDCRSASRGAISDRIYTERLELCAGLSPATPTSYLKTDVFTKTKHQENTFISPQTYHCNEEPTAHDNTEFFLS